MKAKSILLLLLCCCLIASVRAAEDPDDDWFDWDDKPKPEEPGDDPPDDGGEAPVPADEPEPGDGAADPGDLDPGLVREPEPDCALPVVPEDWIRFKRTGKTREGEILHITDATVTFRTATGILYSYPVGELDGWGRKTTLEDAYEIERRAAGADAREHFALHRKCLDCSLEDQAVAELNEAVRLDKNFLEGYETLANYYRDRGAVDTELEVCLRASRAMDEPGRIALRLGLLYERFDMLSYADKQYVAALELDPTDIRALWTHGDVLRRLGRPGDALKRYNEALNLRPDEAHSLCGKGLILETEESIYSGEMYHFSVQATR